MARKRNYLITPDISPEDPTLWACVISKHAAAKTGQTYWLIETPEVVVASWTIHRALERARKHSPTLDQHLSPTPGNN